MRREKKGSRQKDLSPKDKIIEKKRSDYSSRYKGELSPKKDIVEDQYSPTYNSRYK